MHRANLFFVNKVCVNIKSLVSSQSQSTRSSKRKSYYYIWKLKLVCKGFRVVSELFQWHRFFTKSCECPLWNYLGQLQEAQQLPTQIPNTLSQSPKKCLRASTLVLFSEHSRNYSSLSDMSRYLKSWPCHIHFPPRAAAVVLLRHSSPNRKRNSILSYDVWHFLWLYQECFFIFFLARI